MRKLLLLAGSIAACNPPNIAGDTLASPTTGDAFEGVKCSAVRPQSEPDLMAWDPGSRSNLNGLRRQGVVAVRYEAKGCNVELELLSHCIGSSDKYRFFPYSANEHKLAHNANELFAQLPVGAARFAGTVKGTRALRTDYMMAGQYTLPAGESFRLSDLHGPDCARATHVISSVYVGAFVMGAGESRSMEAHASLLGAGAGGASTADVEVLGDEGNADACRESQVGGKADDRCAVPLRIGLLALESAPVSAAAVPAPTVSKTPRLDALRLDIPPKVETDGVSKGQASPWASAFKEEADGWHLDAPVVFGAGGDGLHPESTGKLADIAQYIAKAHPGAKVEVEVHTDNAGDRHLNLKLSEARAESVRKALVAGGLAAPRVSGQGFGPDRPLCGNSTEEGRRCNRRVEIIVRK